jgi:hypothetical protein
MKVDAFRAYDCTASQCELAGNATKLTVEPEGLEKFGEWEGKLSRAGPLTLLHIGNKNTVPATEIKWHLLCPKTEGEEYNKKWKGELTITQIESGTSIGSAPAVLTLPAGKVLEVESTLEGEVSNKLKMMGYAGGEIISVSSP